MHFSAYTITSTQAKLYAALFGIAGAAVGSKSDDPNVIFSLGIGCLGFAYYCLRQHTPGPILARVRMLNTIVSKDQCAYSYKESFETIEKSDFLKFINTSYQDNIREENYPLIISRNELSDLKTSLCHARSLLDYTKQDAEKNTDLKSLWLDLDAQCDKYQTNIAGALARIVGTEPEYTHTLKSYNELIMSNQSLKIQEKNADANVERAKAATKKVHAKQQEAAAVKSYVDLEWFKFIWRLLGYKD